MLRGEEIKFVIKQISVASIKPGKVRGNHYHLKKTEWFLAIGGKAEFYVADPKTGKKECLKLGGKDQKIINVPAGIAHAIKNIDKKTIYFVEVDSQVYNHKNPDAVSYIIA